MTSDLEVLGWSCVSLAYRQQPQAMERAHWRPSWLFSSAAYFGVSLQCGHFSFNGGNQETVGQSAALCRDVTAICSCSLTGLAVVCHLAPNRLVNTLLKTAASQQ
ncbi:hypothetical protein AAFF_G00298420 [Aldrovandia affinis]|uniref:Uncharacterized protein n=1 Tax=Aldrovandia affinis TaxID=143900 RepID=A0AAD7R8P1_9TELE|nr:hypothetical protein AAFF_G00298420 [Aldrovandia affinis]